MKKSILITILLLSITVFFSACGSQEEPATSSEPTGTADEEVLPENSDVISDRLSAAYVDMMKSENYTMKYKTIMDIDGTDMEVDVTMAVSKDRTAVKMESASFSANTIMKEDKSYIVDHDSKRVIVMPFNPDDNLDSPQLQEIDAGGMEFVGTGTGTFMGSNRDYEEYLTEDTRIRYYFDGDDLVGMEIITDDVTTLMIIEDMSDKIDESMFEIPNDYQMMELEI
ncbi:MAG: hypothetical protein ACOX2Q_02355 [Dehalobacterium sp.]|jgi:hypothetical protein